MEKFKLDGVFFRIKRDQKFENICFSDLTEAEQDEVMKGRNKEWLKSMCKILAKSLRNIGETCGIRGGAADDD